MQRNSVATGPTLIRSSTSASVDSLWSGNDEFGEVIWTPESMASIDREESQRFSCQLYAVFAVLLTVGCWVCMEFSPSSDIDIPLLVFMICTLSFGVLVFLLAGIYSLPPPRPLALLCAIFVQLILVYGVPQLHPISTTGHFLVVHRFLLTRPCASATLFFAVAVGFVITSVVVPFRCPLIDHVHHFENENVNEGEDVSTEFHVIRAECFFNDNRGIKFAWQNVMLLTLAAVCFRIRMGLCDGIRALMRMKVLGMLRKDRMANLRKEVSMLKLKIRRYRHSVDRLEIEAQVEGLSSKKNLKEDGPLKEAAPNRSRSSSPKDATFPMYTPVGEIHTVISKSRRSKHKGQKGDAGAAEPKFKFITKHELVAKAFTNLKKELRTIVKEHGFGKDDEHQRRYVRVLGDTLDRTLAVMIDGTGLFLPRISSTNVGPMTTDDLQTAEEIVNRMSRESISRERRRSKTIATPIFGPGSTSERSSLSALDDIRAIISRHTSSNLTSSDLSPDSIPTLIAMSMSGQDTSPRSTILSAALQKMAGQDISPRSNILSAVQRTASMPVNMTPPEDLSPASTSSPNPSSPNAPSPPTGSSPSPSSNQQHGTPSPSSLPPLTSPLPQLQSARDADALPNQPASSGSREPAKVKSSGSRESVPNPDIQVSKQDVVPASGSASKRQEGKRRSSLLEVPVAHMRVDVTSPDCDNHSARSNRSNKSATSNRSNKSTRSTRSNRTGTPGEKSGRTGQGQFVDYIVDLCDAPKDRIQLDPVANFKRVDRRAHSYNPAGGRGRMSPDARGDRRAKSFNPRDSDEKGGKDEDGKQKDKGGKQKKKSAKQKTDEDDKTVSKLAPDGGSGTAVIPHSDSDASIIPATPATPFTPLTPATELTPGSPPAVPVSAPLNRFSHPPPRRKNSKGYNKRKKSLTETTIDEVDETENEKDETQNEKEQEVQRPIQGPYNLEYIAVSNKYGLEHTIVIDDDDEKITRIYQTHPANGGVSESADCNVNVRPRISSQLLESLHPKPARSAGSENQPSTNVTFDSDSWVGSDQPRTPRFSEPSTLSPGTPRTPGWDRWDPWEPAWEYDLPPPEYKDLGDFIGYPPPWIPMLDNHDNEDVDNLPSSTKIAADESIARRKFRDFLFGAPKDKRFRFFSPPNVYAKETKSIMDLLNSEDAWDFDVDRFDRKVDGNALQVLGTAFAMVPGAQMNLSVQKVHRFFAELQHRYRDMSYHNQQHGADVLYSCMHLEAGRGSQYGPPDSRLRLLSELGAIVASAGHDVGHRGKSNRFHSTLVDPIAILYNDQSPLESMSCAIIFKILNMQCAQFLAGGEVTDEEFTFFRTLVIGAILSTDLQRHFEIMSKTAARQAAITKNKQFDEVQAITDISIILKCADVGHPAKPLHIHKEMTKRISIEFLNQGDLERVANLPISPLCDRYDIDLRAAQTGFIEYIVAPVFRIFQLISDDSEESSIQKKIATSTLR